MFDMYSSLELSWLKAYATNKVTFHCLLEEFIKTKQKLDLVSDALYDLDDELLSSIMSQEES